MLYHDYRTGGRVADLLVFPGDEGPAPYERSYSPGYFAAHSEHIIIQTGGSWGGATGYYIGSEYAKPEPFYGWRDAVQS
jgi:hypothetical protein